MKEKTFSHHSNQQHTMSFLKSAFVRLHEYDLLKKVKQQQFQRQPTDFEKVKKIGILFDSRLPEDLEIVRRFIKSLEARDKKVKLLAYFNDRSPHENYSFKSFNKKETDWLMRPKSTVANEFMQIPFDLLINLSMANFRPLEYISALSKAQLRVGPYTEKTYCYDLMVDVPDKKDLSYFIQQIEFFLNRLNSPTYENAPA